MKYIFIYWRIIFRYGGQLYSKPRKIVIHSFEDKQPEMIKIVIHSPGDNQAKVTEANSEIRNFSANIRTIPLFGVSKDKNVDKGRRR